MSNDLVSLRHALNQLRPTTSDERLSLHCCELALQSLADGCLGVGAVITDADGQILAEGRNQVFAGGFDSRAHAEMQAIDHFERSVPIKPREARLFSLLEPCPMCTARALYAGLRSVRYVLADRDGGMLRHLHRLPPAWRELAALQDHAQAEVGPGFTALATRISRAAQATSRRAWRQAIGLDPEPAGAPERTPSRSRQP